MFDLFQPFDEAAQIAIQTGWHNPVLDVIMKALSVANDHGEIWFLIIILMLCFKRTRKCGVCLFFSLGIIFLINQFGLKLMFKRDRPYSVLTQFEPLLPRLKSYSFPSGHSITSFGSAVSVVCSEQHYLVPQTKGNFFVKHKFGILALILAALIAFSRVYLFMHWPTDVIGGAVIATVMGLAISLIFFKVEPKVSAKFAKKKQNP